MVPYFTIIPHTFVVLSPVLILPSVQPTGSQGPAFLAPSHADTCGVLSPAYMFVAYEATDAETTGGVRFSNPGLFGHWNMTLGDKEGAVTHSMWTKVSSSP